MTTMENGDDMFLVIIGDSPGEANLENIPAPTVQYPEQEVDEQNNINEILETAEKYGTIVKIEPEDIDYNDNFEENHQWTKTEIKEEMLEDDPESDEYIPDFSDENDSPYEDISDCETQKKAKGKKKAYITKPSNGTPPVNSNGKRYSMQKPSDHKSFVKELRVNFPELRNDQELLINTLAEIMRGIERPAAPEGYAILSEGLYHCTLCDVKSETEPAANRHYNEKHGERYLTCFACGVDFRSTTNLYKHEKRCIGADATVVLKARATVLGRKARGRPFLKKHLTYVVKPRKDGSTIRGDYPCELCSARFVYPFGLQAHMNMHNGVRPYRCTQCVAAYTSRTAYWRHVRTHSGIEYICDHCKRSFKDRTLLINHLNVHEPLRKFPCEECDNRYAQKAALVRHVNTVHRRLPPPHACDLCPNRYQRMSILKDHMKKVHNITLMTRKMFIKMLPKLTDEELKQHTNMFNDIKTCDTNVKTE